MFSVKKTPNWYGSQPILSRRNKDGWYDMEKVKVFLEGKSFHAVLIDGPAHGERLKILI